MPDIRRDSRQAGEPSLDAIRRSDEFIAALAAGESVVPRDHADAELAELLGGWRDEMRWPPATALIPEPEAVAALEAGLTEQRTDRRDPRITADSLATRKRKQRGLSMVGAAAAAVLCIGGFGAVVATAGPGDALYGLRTMLFGTTKQVRDDQVGLAARTELNQVQELITQGDWDQAQEKLVAVSSQVESLGDAGQKEELLTQFNDLSAKVVERDPAATAPPGVTYTVSPSSTELVPTVVPTSVPAAPSPPDTPTSDSPTGESASPSSEPESASSSATDSSPSAASTTAAPAPSSTTAPAPQTTTPTSGTQTAAAASTSTAGLTPRSTTSKASGTTGASGTAPAAPGTSVPGPAGETPAASAPVAVAPTAAAEAPQSVQATQPTITVTSTVVLPAPVG